MFFSLSLSLSCITRVATHSPSLRLSLSKVRVLLVAMHVIYCLVFVVVYLRSNCILAARDSV